MELLSCNNLEFQYEGKTILKDINFKIDKGNYICIVGENGSGKTTLISGLSGVIKPKKGEIIFSKELSKKDIGYMPQQTQSQKNFPASVYEVVLSGCANKLKISPFYSKKDKYTANRNIELLEITDIKNKCYNNLSGGQQQRVLLARALCATKKLLLLDEPVAGLDPIVTETLYSIIKKLNTEQGITVIMVSHDIKSAVKYASHILHLDNSSSFYGTTEDYLNTDFANFLMGGSNND